MESSEAVKIALLLKTLNSLFARDNLRKNTYIFNALNDRMQLSLKIILQERRIVQITTDPQLVFTAVKQCPQLQTLSSRTLRVLMRGDQTIAKVTKSITKRDLDYLTKKIKCKLIERDHHWIVEFQSPAACKEFVQRVREQKNEGESVVIMERDPYECLKESIASMKKEKRSIEPTPAYSYNDYYYNAPIFIRKAVESDEDEYGPQ